MHYWWSARTTEIFLGLCTFFSTTVWFDCDYNANWSHIWMGPCMHFVFHLCVRPAINATPQEKQKLIRIVVHVISFARIGIWSDDNWIKIVEKIVSLHRWSPICIYTSISAYSTRIWFYNFSPHILSFAFNKGLWHTTHIYVHQSKTTRRKTEWIMRTTATNRKIQFTRYLI